MSEERAQPQAALPGPGPLLREGRFVFTGGATGVADYLGRALLVPHGPRGRMAARLLERVPPGVRAPLLKRSLGRPLEEPPADAHQLRLLASALRRLPTLLRGTPLESRTGTAWVALLDYHGTPRARLVLFLFPADGSSPCGVLKLRDSEREGRSLSSEHRALLALQRHSPAIRESVPVPHRYLEGGGMEALLVSALPGPSLDRLLLSGEVAAARPHLLNAADWLAGFHRETRRRGGWRIGPEERSLALRRLSATGDAGRNALGALAAPLLSGRELPLPVSARHGDFWPRNLIVREDGAGLAVVDWEHFDVMGPCEWDLFHLLVTWGLRAAGEEGKGGGGASGLDASAWSTDVDAALARYGQAAGLARAELRARLHLYLLTRPAGLGAPPDDPLLDRWTHLHRRLTTPVGQAVPA